MLASSPLIAFVATRQPEKARSFYEGQLGLRFISDDPYAIVFRVGETMLRVQKVPELAPAGHTVLGWTVSNIVEVVRWLGARGVSMDRYEHMPQDADGIWTSPSGAKVAWFKDPDGNTLSLTEL
jgi:catechol 2,3-dioxygenase-like lactoylglutathione lyase family enzyme